MLKYTSSFLLLAALAIACSHDTRPATVAKTEEVVVENTTSANAAAARGGNPLESACYQAIRGTDTLSLRIISATSDAVLGELNRYHRQKSDRTGGIMGVLSGDTLFANYSYMEKGKRSVREVAFLYRNGNWVEAEGPLEQQVGVARFADRAKLRFETVYAKVACQ